MPELTWGRHLASLANFVIGKTADEQLHNLKESQNGPNNSSNFLMMYVNFK